MRCSEPGMSPWLQPMRPVCRVAELGSLGIMTARKNLLLPTYVAVLTVISIACFFYPDDMVLPLPLAAVFGPFMAMRLGDSAGALSLLICLGFVAPFIWRRHVLTVLLLCLGVGLWAYTGYVAGRFLYA